MKKLLALLLCSVLLLSIFSGCGKSPTVTDTTPTTEYVPRETPDTKLHEPAADFAGGSGTEADPYQISDASHLVLLNQKLEEESEIGNWDDTYTTAYYILTADISLNDTADFDNWDASAPEYGWKPIGMANDFCGALDGNGHTISGLYLNADANEAAAASRCYGLFGRLSGTVKNLTLDQSYICISGTAKNVGAVAGRMVTDDAVIENCISNAVIRVAEDGDVGGVAGNSSGSIVSCRFGGEITQLDESWSCLGGICGAGGKISGCTNLGSISGNGDSGGIVGYGKVVTDCGNEGAASGDTAGGIAGNLYCAGTGLEMTVTELGLWNCTNKGSVDGTSYAGGIVGKMGNDESDVDMYVSGCDNHGTVNCDRTVAGIIGNLSVARANIVNVENCVNYADISGADKVGGIICELTGAVLNQKGKVTIAGCENNGNMTSTEGMYSGGIVTYFMLMGAEVDLNLTIENCTNSGSVVSRNNAGGILCFSTSMLGSDKISENSSIEFRSCTNTGNILGQASNSFVGGIAGNLGMEGIRTLFDGCTNSGNVSLEFSLTEAEIRETLESENYMSLSQMVGGIVGRLGEGALLTTDNDDGNASNVNADNAWIIFRNCRSSGALEATDYSDYRNEDGIQIWKNYIGGIIGNTCAEDAYAFLVENCTYTGADRGLGNAEYPDVGQLQ